MFFCTQGVIGAWNALPKVVVETDMTVVFERLLNRHMDAINGGIRIMHRQRRIYLSQTLWIEGPGPVLCSLLLNFLEITTHTFGSTIPYSGSE